MKKRNKVIPVLIILLLISISSIGYGYYNGIELLEQLAYGFFIALLTGIVIETSTLIKNRQQEEFKSYEKELKEMKKKIIQYKCSLKKISLNRKKYNFYQQADKIIDRIDELNEQLEYLYNNENKKSLIIKFINKQNIDIDNKKEECKEIKEDIINQADRNSIIRKMFKYSNKFGKLLYLINREIE